MSALVIDNKEMFRVLHSESAFSDRFITYMLQRNVRIEEDLIDQLFNSSQKTAGPRASAAGPLWPAGTNLNGVFQQYPQETLAEMVGTTRSRVNFFMNKFKKMGFIKYNGGLQINASLLSVVLHD